MKIPWLDKKRSAWMRGLLWAEVVIQRHGLEAAALNNYNYTDYAYFCDEYGDFDKAAEACVAYYKRLSK